MTLWHRRAKCDLKSTRNDLGELVDSPELVVVEVLEDMTGLVSDVTTEPVLYTSQRPGELSL